MSRNKLGKGDGNAYPRIFIEEDAKKSTKGLKKEHLTEQFSFLTRSLVKNNVIQDNLYVVLLTFEYL